MGKGKKERDGKVRKPLHKVGPKEELFGEGLQGKGKKVFLMKHVKKRQDKKA